MPIGLALYRPVSFKPCQRSTDTSTYGLGLNRWLSSRGLSPSGIRRSVETSPRAAASTGPFLTFRPPSTYLGSVPFRDKAPRLNSAVAGDVQPGESRERESSSPRDNSVFAPSSVLNLINCQVKCRFGRGLDPRVKSPI